MSDDQKGSPAPVAAEPAPEQPVADNAANGEDKADDQLVDKTAAEADHKLRDKSPERSRERSRDRSRSRDRHRDERDGDFKTRSRSRSRDRHRSRSHERRRHSRSRSRSRSRSADKRSHRTRRSRFEEETEEEREERRRKAAAAAAAASTIPGAADPLAALKASNPALANLDPTAAAALMQRQQLLMQQQLLQQQAALQAQAVLSKAAKTQSSAQRMAEKQQKAQRELFVGNLAPGAVTEQSLYQVFHSALIAAFPQAAQPGQEPVLKVTLTGRFAFVEFRHLEYATAALQLNGQIALMGNTLKIARPSSYVEPTQANMMGMGAVGMPGALPGMMGMAAPAAAAPGMMPGHMAAGGFPGMPGMLPGPPSGGASDGLATPIPTPYLGVNGMITADVLASDAEYKEAACLCICCTCLPVCLPASSACLLLPLLCPALPLHVLLLHCCCCLPMRTRRPCTPLTLVAAPPPAPFVNPSPPILARLPRSALHCSGDLRPHCLVAPCVRHTQVLVDLVQECGKYGTVVGLKVPRPPPGTAAQLINTGHFGKAFVQFADVPSAQRAKDAITGRMFAGNIVQAYHIPLPVYQSVPESAH